MKLTAERFKEIADRVLSGQSYSQITGEMQCSHSTLRDVRRQLAGPLMSKRKELSQEVLKSLLRLLKRGDSVASIARELTIDNSTIRKHRYRFLSQGKLKAKVPA